jgi:hypothetical protein
VGERGDAGAAVDVDADVALAGEGGLAGVQPDPDEDRPAGECGVTSQGCCGRAAGGWKGDEEGVSLRVHLDPALGGEHVTQQPPVLR